MSAGYTVTTHSAVRGVTLFCGWNAYNQIWSDWQTISWVAEHWCPCWIVCISPSATALIITFIELVQISSEVCSVCSHEISGLRARRLQTSPRPWLSCLASHGQQCRCNSRTGGHHWKNTGLEPVTRAKIPDAHWMYSITDIFHLHCYDTQTHTMHCVNASYSKTYSVSIKLHSSQLTELWFYFPLDTTYVISETFPQHNLLAWYGKKTKPNTTKTCIHQSKEMYYTK